MVLSRGVTRIVPRSASRLTTTQIAEMTLSGQADLAYKRLIDLVRRTPGDERETVRKHLVSLFTVAGPDDPAVAKARRALASALF